MAAKVAKVVAILVTGAAAALGIAAAVDDDDGDPGLEVAKQAAPDTPPAEFAYLDSGRVLAYIGQIQGGLAATLTKTLSDKKTTKASLTAKDVAAVEASSETLRGSSETVTLTEADRFYTLLRILRADQGFPTLVNINATVTGDDQVEQIRRKLRRIDEGTFVRIENARLYIPPYAAVLPRARFASLYLGGKLELPERALYAPVRRKARRAVARYKAALNNPRVPMVLPTLGAEQGELRRPVTFFLPARYRSLSREASLLGGELTVVGKVVYNDHRLPREVTRKSWLPERYLDRETLTRFAPALRQADGGLLERLGLRRDRIVKKVTRSLTIKPPVAVVIPLAIYQ